MATRGAIFPVEYTSLPGHVLSIAMVPPGQYAEIMALANLIMAPVINISHQTDGLLNKNDPTYSPVNICNG